MQNSIAKYEKKIKMLENMCKMENEEKSSILKKCIKERVKWKEEEEKLKKSNKELMEYIEKLYKIGRAS